VRSRCEVGHGHQQVIARFEAERQALALMDHPNIAKCLMRATDSGRPSSSCNCRASDTDYCDERNLSTGERLDLFMQVCPPCSTRTRRASFTATSAANVLVTELDGKLSPR